MASQSTPQMGTDVAEVFETYPVELRAKLLTVRQLIFATAAATKDVGPITETLKWGEPAYITAVTKSGSTIRIGCKPSVPDSYAIYFNCRTNLVETFRHIFSDEFSFEGNRAIKLKTSDEVPMEPLATCIAMALTYHRTKRKK